MAFKKLVYILSFKGNEHQWMMFDGRDLIESEGPADKNKHPVVALLPDPLFFFFKPRGAIKSRHAKSATMMQMNYSFPMQEGEFKVLRPSGDAVLGYTGHDLLDRFLDRHREVLAKATVLTTAFTVCWRAAVAEGLSVWAWKGQGVRILACADELTYFRGNDEEFQNRFERLGLDGEPEFMDLGKACDVFAKKKVRWARLNLVSGKRSGSDKSITIDYKPYAVAAVLVSLIGVLFIAGQYHRWQQSQVHANEWRNKLKETYVSALGPNPGSDPYGKILYKLDQLKSGGDGGGIDVLGLLAVLSNSAPVGIEIEGFSLGADSGNIRGKVSSYEELDAMMEKLAANSQFNFVLEQANNIEGGISISLRAEYNR
ncbi:hypothetical protein [Maridesulfovibrio salexigens]|uniref:Uncharacterized protein n=1 Tax=Maridesulfovibrio salexigens (strain ATCC 14822 / DSM 2638 / NCIMB 8403 / VKM B-1763) TaxID=526222 RepID=C6BTF6_MARSD|nr:hypothetical protein [Maridesulfovibrio salexigens]ACS81637.1 hypothetical protein Desal_3591 [Maridesulfovibrio salexigens DSM 2638]